MPKGIQGFQKGHKFGRRSPKGYHPKSEFKKDHSPTKGCFKKGQKSKNWNGFKKGHFPTEGCFKKGSEHPDWITDRSFLIYPDEWTTTLKKSIRQRDNYICQLCGRTQEEELERYERKLSVHHIDYDKKNCNPTNLITLCKYCNSKVNFNKKHWTKYFYESSIR